MKNPIYLFGAILFALTLAGCSLKSEETAISEAETAAEEAFYDEAQIKANEEINGDPIYIPAHLTVESNDESNLILEDGKQTYIVFKNPIESAQSEMNFNAASKNEKVLVLESFNNDTSFGYIRILPKIVEGYEMQVGVGGV
ncbi:hypothetical protein, partial [Oceanobacillus massiliensis]|uniref:hypothetical protein n=1 Tax=Oceanobacillus massiliensis TaxID=1465765 RepID=UPI0030193CA1